jgi:DNA-binding transcriptional ArsR family regulator
MRMSAHRDMKILSDANEQIIANRARALGDPTRVRILSVLARGEQAVGQIAEASATRQSTASKHLQVLFHAGLVQRRRDASAVFYSVSSADVLRVCRLLRSKRFEPRVKARPLRRV